MTVVVLSGLGGRCLEFGLHGDGANKVFPSLCTHVPQSGAGSRKPTPYQLLHFGLDS